MTAATTRLRGSLDATGEIPLGGSLAIPLRDAIGPLAALWRDTQRPEVAERLVALSNAYATFFPRLPKKGDLFERLVARRAEAMLGVLLRSVTHGRELAAELRLAAVVEAWNNDPRVVAYLSELGAARPYRGSTAFAKAIAAARRKCAAATTPPTRGPSPNDAIVLADVDALLASVPARQRALTLVRDVYRAPEDLSRRLVLADALMDLGDAWGEFIALQCTRDDGRSDAAAEREGALLSIWRDSWLGRLRPQVEGADVVFEHGFPAGVDFASRGAGSSRTPRVAGIAEWATVARIEGAPSWTLQLLGHPRRPRRATVVLRVDSTIRPIHAPALEDLTARLHFRPHPDGPRRGLYPHGADRATATLQALRAWVQPGAVPRLRRLSVEGALERYLDPTRPWLELESIGALADGASLFEGAARCRDLGRRCPTLVSRHGTTLRVDFESRTLSLRFLAYAMSQAELAVFARFVEAHRIARVELTVARTSFPMTRDPETWRRALPPTTTLDFQVE